MRFFKSLIYTVAFLMVGQGAFGQNYIDKGEMSGFDISPYQSELQEAADSLIAAFPDSVQNNFKVFSYGFYIPIQSFDGYGYPEAFETMRQKVATESPYYLLIGRQSDDKGLFTKFWVDIKFPFDTLCLSQRARQIIINDIQWKGTDEYKKLGKLPSNFFASEIKAINTLTEKINYLTENCCSSYFQKTTSCDDCPDDEAIQRKLIEKGFVGVEIDSFNLNPIVVSKSYKFGKENNNLIEASNDISVWLNDFEWNLNSGLNQELSEYSTASKKGVVVSSIDFCSTDIYSLISNDFYSQFEVAVIYVLWTKTNPNTLVVEDSKFYFKEFFPELVATNFQNTLSSNEPKCHPDFGVYSEKCERNELPSSFDTPIGTYQISTDVNGKYFGYIYQGDYYWSEEGTTEVHSPIVLHQEDGDNTCCNCDDYYWSEYSEYARRQAHLPTEDLISTFERWTKNNIFVGLEDDMDKIIQHFYTGNGEDLVWGCDEDFSKYIYLQASIQSYLDTLQVITHNWLSSPNHRTLDGMFTELGSEIDSLWAVKVAGGVPGIGGSAPFNATAAISLGGLQGREIRIIEVQEFPCTQNYQCYEISLHLTIEDIFGAGDDDRDRGGPGVSQVPLIGDGRIPGLTQMWLLQHCRNFSNDLGYTFKPFNHYVNIGHKFKVCIKRYP